MIHLLTLTVNKSAVNKSFGYGSIHVCGGVFFLEHFLCDLTSHVSAHPFTRSHVWMTWGGDIKTFVITNRFKMLECLLTYRGRTLGMILDVEYTLSQSVVWFRQQFFFDHAKSSCLHCICIRVFDRSRMEKESLLDSDSAPQWCGAAITQHAPGGESESSTSSEAGTTVKSLIKSFDTAVKSEDSHLLFLFHLFFSSRLGILGCC